MTTRFWKRFVLDSSEKSHKRVEDLHEASEVSYLNFKTSVTFV